MSTDPQVTLSENKLTLLLVGLLVFYVPLSMVAYATTDGWVPLLIATLEHLAAMGMGATLIRFLVPSWRKKAEQWVWGWVFGLGAFGILMFFFSRVGLFNSLSASLLIFCGFGAEEGLPSTVERLKRELQAPGLLP